MPSIARSSQASALFNWNYAAIYGTGFYNIGEETVAVARVPLAGLVRELWPVLWAQLGVLVLLSLFPALSSWLPGVFGYR